LIEGLLEWLVEQVGRWGAPGIFAMMFLESTFFPFPSEVAMIPAGYLAYRGELSATAAILAGLAGSVFGAYFNYFLARRIGVPFLRRYGRYFFFDEARLERSTALFRRHGEITTFVCRLVPVVRQYISLPAGIAGMNRVRFGLYTGLGAGIWVAILTGFGYWLGQALTTPTWASFHEQWKQHESLILLGLGIPLLVVVLAYVFVHQRRKRAQPQSAQPPQAGLEERAVDGEGEPAASVRRP
jgi:membrane protein DedA with SNARE-associated domain